MLAVCAPWRAPERIRPSARRRLRDVDPLRRRQRLPGRLPPTDTERVAGWVGVDLMSLIAFQVTSMEVYVYLLWRAVRPVKRNVLRRQLNTNTPLTSRVDDAVECLIVEDIAVKHSRPCRAGIAR